MFKTRTVYLISSSQTDKIYIGSTCQSLQKRLYAHQWRKNTTSKEITKFEDVKIDWLYTKQNCTRKEIELYEQEFILLFKDICVNFLMTKNRYSKEYKAPYELDGRKKIYETTRKVCSICKGTYLNPHKSKHFKTKKHLEKVT
jgi:hypothetical protein